MGQVLADRLGEEAEQGLAAEGRHADVGGDGPAVSRAPAGLEGLLAKPCTEHHVELLVFINSAFSLGTIFDITCTLAAQSRAIGVCTIVGCTLQN